MNNEQGGAVFSATMNNELPDADAETAHTPARAHRANGRASEYSHTQAAAAAGCALRTRTHTHTHTHTTRKSTTCNHAAASREGQI